MECMCRVCETIYDLRNMFEEENEELLLMLRSVADITITVDDLLPKYLCSTCSRRLQRAYDFKLQCELTDQKLRETLEPDKPSSPYKEQDSKEQHENNLEELLYKRLYEKTVKGEAAAQPSSEDYGTTFNYVISEVKGEKAPVPNAASVEIPNLIVNPPISIDTKEIPIPNEKTVIFVEDSKKMDIGMKFEVVEESTCFEDIIEEDYTEEPMVAEPVEQKMVEVREIAVVIPEAIDPPKEEPKTEPQEIFSELSVEKKEEEATQEPTPSVSADMQSIVPAKKAEKAPKAPKEPRVYSCIMCSEIFDSGPKLNNHRRKHGRLRFQCTVCNKSFGRSNGLRDHLLTHIGKKVPCHLCDKKCSNRGNLLRHIQQCHQKLKPFKCEYCGIEYSRKATLQSHVAAHHENVPPCPCDICGRLYKTAFYMAIHRKKHDKKYKKTTWKQVRKERILFCPQCGKKSRSLPTHISHMRIHSEVKAFACQECPKRFHFKQTLLTHMLCHTGERPFSCEACGKSFRQLAHLKTHTKTVHMGAREFQCQYCKKFFTSSGTLKIHERLHTGERPYVCDMCPNRFIDSKGLKKHKLSAHNNSEVDSNEASQDQASSINMDQDGDSDDDEDDDDNYDDSQTNELEAIPDDQITFEDPLPKHICGICARKLCQSYEFIKQCENTDQKLRRHCDADALRKGRAASGVFGLHCNQYEERDAAAQWEIIYNGEDSYGDLNSHDEEHSSDLNLIDCIYQGYAEADDVIVVKDELSMDAQELDAVDENPEFLEEDNSESSTKDSAGYFSTKPSPNDETVVPVAQADENTAEDCVLSNQDGSFDDFIVEEVEQSENDEQNENDDERTRSPAALQYANLKTKPPKIFKCNSCSATFTNFRELNTHKKSHGEKRFECPTCLKRFSRHYRMREHLQTHTNPRKLPCPLCNNTYTNRGNLDRHVRHCHNKEKTHACEYCGMSFARKATLKVHFATHSDARDFECGKCGKKFKTAYYLNVHQKSHIPMELRLNKRPKQKRKSQTCICHCCGKTSRTLSLHINHMRTHSGERPFECPTCLKRFTFKQTLKTHMLLHSGEKPYICDICNMAFRQVAHLNGHKVALHTGLKQHKCQFCDKSFALRSNLTIHARLHTGDKPHQCTICGKRFNDTNGLKRHRISHTRNGLVETPTQCEKAQMKAASRKEEDASELNKLDVGLDQLNVYLDELGNEYTEIIETETILEAAT